MSSKKKSKIEEECQKIILENTDLGILFANTEKILEYTLANTLNPVELKEQLEIIGGKSFSRFLLFLLRRQNYTETISNLSSFDINEDLLNKVKLVLAKYSPSYNKLRQRIDNEYGWSSVEYNIVKNSEKYYLEFIMDLYNGNKLFCRDNPNSMLLFMTRFLAPMIELSESYSFDSRLVLELYEKSKELYSKTNLDENDHAKLEE